MSEGVALLLAGVLIVGCGERAALVPPTSGRAAASDATARPRFIPRSVSFISPSLGWAWGPAAHSSRAGVLARTDDGGRTWSVVRTPGMGYAQVGYPGGVSGVRFVDRLHGYLFGGQLWRTVDGGKRWLRLHTRGLVLDMETGAGRAYALVLACASVERCQTAHLYRVSGGLGRALPPLSVNANWYSLVVHRNSVYLLTASQPHGNALRAAALWVSHNLGGSWMRLSAPCGWPGALGGTLAAWSSSGLALACGSEPGTGNQAKTFYVSTDAGVRWRLTGRLAFGPGYIASLSAADRLTWVLAEGRQPAIEVTHDGGRSWRGALPTQRGTGDEGWGYVAFTDRAQAVAVPWTLNGSVLAFTHDGARTWTEVAFPSGR